MHSDTVFGTNLIRLTMRIIMINIIYTSSVKVPIIDRAQLQVVAK